MLLEQQLMTIQTERDHLKSSLSLSQEEEQTVKKQLQEQRKRGEELSTELNQETGRLNTQFELAVKLLKDENGQLKVYYLIYLM